MDDQQQQSGIGHGEANGSAPMINAPRVVVILIAIFGVVHVSLQLMDDELAHWLSLAFAFSPARISPPPELVGVLLPGGDGAKVWTFFSHMFLHGDWLHLGINSLWMLAFGSVVARWMGAGRFIAFSLLCAAGGAVASQIVYWGTLSFMVGASGAISGQMAGAVRLMFASGDRLVLFNAGQSGGSPLPLGAILTHRRARVFIAVWMGVNVVFGVLGLGAGANVSRIAWEAHAGGFIAGLVLLGLFARRNMA